MVDDPIGGELHRLAKEFRKLAGLPTDSNAPETTSLEQFTQFGLTLDEVEAWLEQERGHIPTDEFLHRYRNRRRLDRTRWLMRCSQIFLRVALYLFW